MEQHYILNEYNALLSFGQPKKSSIFFDDSFELEFLKTNHKKGLQTALIIHVDFTKQFSKIGDNLIKFKRSS